MNIPKVVDRWLKDRKRSFFRSRPALAIVTKVVVKLEICHSDGVRIVSRAFSSSAIASCYVFHST